MATTQWCEWPSLLGQSHQCRTNTRFRANEQTDRQIEGHRIKPPFCGQSWTINQQQQASN